MNTTNNNKVFSWCNPEDLKIFDLNLAKQKAVDFLNNLTDEDLRMFYSSSSANFVIHHLVRNLETIKKIGKLINHPLSKIHNLSTRWLATGSVAELRFWFNARECVYNFRIKCYSDKNGLMIDRMHELLGELLALSIVNTIAKAFEIETNNTLYENTPEVKARFEEVVEETIKTVASKEMRHMLMSPILHPDYNTVNTQWLYDTDGEEDTELKQELIKVKERCEASIDALANLMSQRKASYLDIKTGATIEESFIKRCQKNPFSISTAEIIDLLCDEDLEDFSVFDVGHIIELFHQVFLLKVRENDGDVDFLMNSLSTRCDDLNAMTTKTPQHYLIDNFERAFGLQDPLEKYYDELEKMCEFLTSEDL